jgi:TIR domain
MSDVSEPDRRAFQAVESRQIARLKVFISYSRQDMTFADELVAGLEYDGSFQVLIDRHDIHEGENWRRRLGGLIAEADTIVFVLSPRSAASPICRWEVAEATRLSKRILPVLAVPLADVEPPSELGALNYVRFDEGRSFMAGLTALRRALNADIGWLREHTRLLARARDWDTIGRRPNRLLIGSDIEAAKSWLAHQPKEAPPPTELHRDFVQASEQAEAERTSAERRRANALQRAVGRMRAALAVTVLLVIVAAGAAGYAFLKRQTAEKASQELEKTVAELKAREEDLKKALELARRRAMEFASFKADLRFKERGYSGADDPRIKQIEQNLKANRKFTPDDVPQYISKEAHDLVLYYEVGGKEYYDKRYHSPSWPGAASGVTIGIGYDLGYNSLEDFDRTWRPRLSPQDAKRLEKLIGLKGAEASNRLIEVADISIPWEVAMTVYRETTVKRYGNWVLSTFPGAEKLPPGAFGALFSIVFNRGRSLRGDSRLELRLIKALILIKEYEGVPDQIRSMKSIWDLRNLDGLLKRREAEANLFEHAIARIKEPAKAKKR